MNDSETNPEKAAQGEAGDYLTSLEVSQDQRVHGVVLGQFQGFDTNGEPLVVFPRSEGARRAQTTVSLEGTRPGSNLTIMFLGGELQRPIITGILMDAKPSVEVLADGEPQVVEASHELVLKCGEASIRLTRDGKVYIRGTHILSRSSGGHKIKGAYVHIN